MNTGLWNKVSKNGKTYASGKIEINGKLYKITLFANENKKTEKSPDFSLILDEMNNYTKNEKTTHSEAKNAELEQNKNKQEDVFRDFGDKIKIDEMDIGF